MPKVIKNDGQLAPVGPSTPALVDRRVINRDVFSAQQRADDLRQAADQRASERRALGAQQAQQAYQAAHREGKDAGLAAVCARAIDAYFQRAQQLRQAVDDCLLIARHICSKIMGREPEVAEAEERRIANELLLQAIKKQRLVIGVSVRDYGALERNGSQLLTSLAGAPEFSLESVATTPDGGVTVHIGDQAFVSPLGAALDQLCGLLKLPKVNLKTVGLPPARNDPSTASPTVGAAAAAEEDFASEPAAPAAADGEVAERDPEAEVAGDLAAEPGADGTQAVRRRRPEPLDLHDISRLVAAIDAEEDE